MDQDKLRKSFTVLPHVTGPVICLTGLSTVADLALGTSPQSRLPVVRHAAGVVLLKEGGRGVGDLIHQLWYLTLEE